VRREIMRRSLIYAVIAIFIAISGLLAQEQSEQEALAKKVVEIEKEVAKIRGKDFKKDVPVGVKDREELKKFILEEMEKESPEEEIRKSQKVLEKFGLIKEGTDLKKVLVDVLNEQLAGFYEPEKKELFLIKGTVFKAGSAEEDTVVAHELTHALQDQYFDLRSFTQWVRNNDDKALALKSVMEGEANLLCLDYLFKKMYGKGMKDIRDLGQILKIQSELAAKLKGDSELNKAPAVIRESLLFPYISGASFCHQFLRKNDWKGLDRLFENPPLSTEQILHPEKYLETTDYPTALKMPELLKQFEGEWQLLDDNCVGEFGIGILIRQFLSPEDAKKASEGWDGDRYQALEEKKTGRVVIAWITTWDTKEDAQDFAKLYTSALAKKYNKTAEKAQNASVIFVKGDAQLACVEHCGTEVIIVDSASKAELEKIRPELLKTVKVVSEEHALEEFAKQPFAAPPAPAEKVKEEQEKKPEGAREF
jgi:hypothetical protein